MCIAMRASCMLKIRAVARKCHGVRDKADANHRG
jgi:hypothetical protein